MVSLKSISVRFKDAKRDLQVLENFNLEAGAGEIVCILGPSGCGKSSLLRAACGLITYEGEVIVADKTPARASADKEIGFLFQESLLIPWKNVIDNILLPASLGEKPTDSGREKAEEWLKLVGLEKYAHFFPHQLSGGMKQRVAVARTMFFSPRVVFLDEPFAAVDALTRQLLIIELNSILRKSGATVLMVTHSFEEAAFLADRIIVLSSRPAKVRKVLPVHYERPRNSELFLHSEFTHIVNTCRKILFENEL